MLNTRSWQHRWMSRFKSSVLPPTRQRNVLFNLGAEALESRRMLAGVTGRYVFYNQSVYDGADQAATARDDAAIASDKVPLFAGQTASFANYTSYHRGLNGVMVDVMDLADPAALSLSDFSFRVGNTDELSNWTDAPAPAEVAVREGAGVDGADRVTLIWPDNAIQNQWLEITVDATPHTGLVEPDVFVFGNMIGDSGDEAYRAMVSELDERGPREHPHAFFNLAGIDDPFDYNRDRYVNATDQVIARNNRGEPTSALHLLGTGDAPVRIVYDPITGSLMIVSDFDMTTIEVVSQTGRLTGDRPSAFSGLFDVYTTGKAFRLDPGGFSSVDLGQLSPGLSLDFLLNDLHVSGSLLSGGSLGNYQIFVQPSIEGVLLRYDAATGNLRLTSDFEVSSFHVISDRGVFTGEPAIGLDGEADVDDDHNLYKEAPAGIIEFELGNVMPSGLTQGFLISDLSIAGTNLDGSDIASATILASNAREFVYAEYDANDGTITIEGPLLEAVEIRSADGILTGLADPRLDTPEEVDTDERIVLVDDNGFQTVTFPHVGQVGWFSDYLRSDLIVTGTLFGGQQSTSGVRVIPPTSLTELVYSTDTGNVSLQTELSLSEFEVNSAAGIFTGNAALNLGGPNDVDEDGRVVKQSPTSFGSVDFGPIAVPDLSRSAVARDLAISGTLSNGAGLGNVRLRLEPARTAIIYDATTGIISFETNEDLADLSLRSATGMFRGSCTAFEFLSDCSNRVTSGTLPDAQTSGVLRRGATKWLEPDVASDLSFSGTLYGGGEPSFELIVIPEMDPTFVTYDAATGGLSFDTPFQLGSFEVMSASGRFTQDAGQNVDGQDDLDTDSIIRKVSPSGFESLSFGNVVETGLTESFLRSDVTFAGTLANGDPLTNIQLVVTAQENVVQVTYDANTGSLLLSTNAPLQELIVDSSVSLFGSQPGDNLNGPDDVLISSRMQKSDPTGFRNVDFGPIAQTGWTENVVDVTISAKLLGGDVVLNPQFIHIPEVSQNTIIYDANTGELSLETSLQLTTVEVVSATGIFTGDPAQNLGGQFDVDTDAKIFKLAPQGIGGITFGNVARHGLPHVFVERDLAVTGSRLIGGPLGNFIVETIPTGSTTAAIYDAHTGEFWLQSDRPVTSISVSSAVGIFTADPANNLDGPNDVDTDFTIVKQDQAGFTEISLGPVAGKGFLDAFLNRDLQFEATLQDGTPVEEIELYVIPNAPDLKVVFDASTGELSYIGNSPLESIDVISASGIFTGDAATQLGGANDVDTDTRILKHDPRGIVDVSFGAVAETGLADAFLLDDLTVFGTFLGESESRPVDLEIIPDFGETIVTFDARVGTVRLVTNLVLTQFEIMSARGIFSGRDSLAFNGPNDVDTDTHLLKVSEAGFSTLFLGEVAVPGLTESFVGGDLTISGQRVGGGGLGNVEFKFVGAPSHATVIIDSAAGSVSVSSNAALETFQIQSDAGIFTGDPALDLGGASDVDTDATILKRADQGFQSVMLGPVMQSGWGDEFLTTDLVFSATLLGGTEIDSIDTVIIPDLRSATLTYNWQTGAIYVASDVSLSRLEIQSDAGIFTAQPASNLGGPNDVDSDSLIVKEDPNGITSIDFGAVAQLGLSRQDIFDDLTFVAERPTGVPQLNYRIVVQPQQIGLIYQTDIGELTLESDELLTTLEIVSNDRLFTGQRPEVLNGLFDVFAPGKLFRLDPAGFGSLEFGAVLPPDLTQSFLAADLTVNGSLLDGGAIGDLPIVVNGHRDPTITYDAASGEISVDVEDSLTFLSITSAAGIFTADPAANLSGPLDVDTNEQLSIYNEAGIDDFTLGTVAITGLTEPFVANDLTIRGTYVDGSPFSGARVQVIPQVNDVGVTYDATTGQITVQSNAPLESIVIESDVSFFPLDTADSLGGPDDELSSMRLKKVDSDGFRDIAFGAIAQSGWLVEDLTPILTVTATLLGGVQVDAVPLTVIPETAATRFVYDANTGALSWDSPHELTTLEIVSQRGIFTGDAAANLDGQFDVDNDRKLFKLQVEGFTSFDFGNVAETALPGFLLQHDLSIAGSRARGGPLGVVEIETIPFEDQASVVYDARSGAIAIESDVLLTSLEIASQRGVLTGDAAADLISPNDVDTDTRIFKEDLFGFTNAYFGNVAEDGLTESFVNQDLSFQFATKGGAAASLELFVIPHQPSATLVYDEPTGELWLETNSPLESVEIVSAGGILNADPAENLGFDDIDSDTRIYKRDLAGFRGLSFGTVINPGMEAEVLADLNVTVILLGGEVLSDVALQSIPDLGETSVRYDASSGTIRIKTNLDLDSLVLESERGIFVGLPATTLDGPQDVDSDTQLAKVDSDGFRTLTLRNVAVTGLTEAFVASDLTVRGTRIGGGGLGVLTLEVGTVEPVIGVTFDSATGTFSVDSNMLLESIEISSVSGILSEADSPILDGPDDIDTDNRIVNVDFGGFHHLEFAAVAQQGWDSEFIASDITVSGTLFGGVPAEAIFVVVRPDQRVTRVVYNRLTGGLSVDTDVELKSISIESVGGIFTTGPAESLPGANDVDTDVLIMKEDEAGFTDVQFGAVAETGYDFPFIVSDFVVSGMRFTGAPLQNIRIAVEPSSTNLIYNRATGEVFLEANPLLTTLEIVSSSGIFTGRCGLINGLFDVCTPGKYFKLDPSGFGNVSLGTILPPGLDQEFLDQNLSFSGSTVDGGPLMISRVVIIDPPAAFAVHNAGIPRRLIRDDGQIKKKRDAREQLAADLVLETDEWLLDENTIRVLSEDLKYHALVA
ncbi:MAG: hypothetical protein KDB27_14360 [Planctomycetales bacterium]|nr:hypothetical protein [Planctomycetales bacterium]